MPSLMHRRRVLGGVSRIDVHKDGIVAAVAEGGRRGEDNKFLAKLASDHRNRTGCS